MDFSQLLEITSAFLANTLLLMGIAVVYSIFPIEKGIRTITKKIILGLIVGVIGVTIMSTHYVLSPGIVFDARSIAMLTSGVFLGTIPTLIGAVFMVLYRSYMGGAGVYTGISWIIVPGMLGLLYRHFRLKSIRFRNVKVSWVELYFLSLFVQVIMILLLFTMPSDIRIGIISSVAIPVLLIYPIGGLLISLFMLNQRRRFFLTQRVYKSEKQYRNLFSKSKTKQLLLDLEGNIVDVNDSFIHHYGYSLEELKQMNIADINVLSKEEIQEAIKEVTSNNRQFFKFQHRKKNGEIIDVETHSGSIQLEGKEYILSTAIDVTKLLESKRKYLDTDEKLKATFLSVSEGIVVTDENGRITLINDKAKEILGESNTVIGERISTVFRVYSATSKDSFYDIIYNSLRKNIVYRSDSSFSLITNDSDKEIFVDFTVSPINADDKINNGVILVIRDVTIEKKRQDEIRFISHHDFLTKLHNRYYFEEEISRLDTARQLPLSIILGDVNGLKLVNDTFSHLEGDQLLIEIASIFRKACRTEDIIARWGGDEFVILLPQTSGKDALTIYDRIKTLCENSDYSTIKPSVSLGIATKINSNDNIYDVLLAAETKMYREKLQEGKSMRSTLLQTLETTLIEKSYETEEHAQSMIDMSNEFGKYLNLDKDDINTLTLLARLHDIGKIAVDNEILMKTTKLTSSDWDQIKTHPLSGAKIVSSIPELKHVSDGILHHHEKWDGTGYPANLKSNNIPLLSRVISIIDSFEVMTSGRVYKSAITIEESLNELERCKGTQFDPYLTEQFIEMVRGQQ